VVDERLLETVKLPGLGVGQPLDRGHVCVLQRDREQQACVDAAAPEQHGASATLAVVAAFL
jgi:hypothetical protein